MCRVAQTAGRNSGEGGTCLDDALPEAGVGALVWVWTHVPKLEVLAATWSCDSRGPVCRCQSRVWVGVGERPTSSSLRP